MIADDMSEQTGLRDRRILVVDDNVDAASSMAELLRLMGNDVRCSHDGPAALGIVKEYRPDMVLVDIGLPGMTGHDVVREIRRESGDGKMLIVALSGYGSQEHRRQSIESGCDAHFVKPMSLSQLQEFAASRGC